MMVLSLVSILPLLGGIVLGGILFAGGALLIPKSESKIAGIVLLVIGTLLILCPLLGFGFIWFSRLNP